MKTIFSGTIMSTVKAICWWINATTPKDSKQAMSFFPPADNMSGLSHAGSDKYDPGFLKVDLKVVLLPTLLGHQPTNFSGGYYLTLML